MTAGHMNNLVGEHIASSSSEFNKASKPRETKM